ncbi:hypothetical protein VIH_002953 [Vibrio cholerae CT 5369-93]|nr:hypothetical protein VIH_002953 [Vibrio cholerae CT 5369-93]
MGSKSPKNAQIHSHDVYFFNFETVTKKVISSDGFCLCDCL